MSVGDDRIQFQVLPGSAAGPDLAAVLIGHLPGRVSRENLAREPALADALRPALADPDLAARVARWREAAGDDPSITSDELYGVALPIRSLAQLQRLFPDVQLADAASPAQARHWLPWAVQDYFAAGSSGIDGRLCWVIRVPEPAAGATAGLDLLAPRPGAVRHLPETWGPVELACTVEDAGLLLLPDFERLLFQPPAGGVPRKRLPNPSIAFHPCGADLDDGHRERRWSSEMPAPVEDPLAMRRIGAIAARLNDWRPDLHWLCALAADIDGEVALPRPTAGVLAGLRGARAGSAAGDATPPLAQVQFLFPLVYGPRRPLTSPSGLVAGQMVAQTARAGVWRSVAGLALTRDLAVWPELGRGQRAALREDPGLGVLYPRDGALLLDDERLVTGGPCGYGDACRAGELMRFMGWIRRSLRRLGEALVFRVDGRDPEVGNVLDAFLNSLYRQGALRGVSAADAYRLTNLSSRGSERIEYRIELAPSFPVDRLEVTFLHDRNANSPRLTWTAGAGVADA